MIIHNSIAHMKRIIGLDKDIAKKIRSYFITVVRLAYNIGRLEQPQLPPALQQLAASSAPWRLRVGSVMGPRGPTDFPLCL